VAEHLAEDELLELAAGRRSLVDDPAAEAHLADCPTCGALLRALLSAPGADEATSPTEARVGRQLGPYRLDGLIGAGGMGEVYRAWDTRLHRHVAVKVLPRDVADAPDRIRRLEAEGRAAAAIAHPNVVTVHDSGSADGVAYVVSELVAGESLRSLLARGPLARATAIDLAVQLARGLAAAHGQGVVHRDLKPENLIVTDDGTLKILDFGLARSERDHDPAGTEPGTVRGTAGYLAPEQARGERGDARSDLFAVGALVYELLAGRRAFPGDTFVDRLLAGLRDQPAPLADPAWPIVARCLDKDPRRRFQTADDLAWALEGARAAEPPTTTPPTTTPTAATASSPAARAAPGAVSRRAFVVGAAVAAAGGALVTRLIAAPPRRRAPPLRYRQLTFRQGRVASARFTPDGGSVLYTALWDELPATIHTARLGGGGTRALDLPPAQLLAVSARGELALALDHRFVDGFAEQGQLALAPLEGGPPRALGAMVQHADFTPDGAELAIVRRQGDRFRLELPAGNVLLEAGWLSHPRVAPDGRHVACLVHDDPGDNAGVVALIARADRSRRTLGPPWTSVDGLAWAGDGRTLWVSAARRGGDHAIRALGLDGRERAVVPSASRLRIDDVGADGAMAATQVGGRLRMMVRAPGARDELDLALSDIALVTDLAADGRALVFVEFGDVDTANGGYLRSSAGGPAVRLGPGVPVDLADDGRGVLAWLPAPRPTLVIYPVPDGPARTLAVPRLATMRTARWCADGVVIEGAEADRPPRLWRLDDGALTPISDEGVRGLGAVSADGRAVAIIADDRLLVLDVAGARPPRVVPGRFVDQRVCGWHAGDAEVQVWSGASREVRRVELATGAATTMLSIAPPRLGQRGVYAVTVSADGAAYAYSYGQELSRLYIVDRGDADPRAERG